MQKIFVDLIHMRKTISFRCDYQPLLNDLFFPDVNTTEMLLYYSVLIYIQTQTHMYTYTLYSKMWLVKLNRESLALFQYFTTKANPLCSVKRWMLC